MNNIEFIFDKEEILRVDQFLTQMLPDMTRSYISKILDSGLVTVNNKIAKKSLKLSLNDKVVLPQPQPIKLDVEAQDIELNIAYEDSDIIVVDKTKGMVVHPAPGHSDNTLVNALLAHCDGQLSGINGVMRPGIVHRIDKNTSGLLIVAKNDVAHKSLAAQIAEHTFTREYIAIAHGEFKDQQGTVNAPIGRHPRLRQKMAVTDINSKEAITHYTVLETFERFTYLSLKLETGRTHQIRVHLSYIHHPIMGDLLYGSNYETKKFDGQCLHAKRIGFIHPTTNQYLELESPPPPYFEMELARLKNIKI